MDIQRAVIEVLFSKMPVELVFQKVIFNKNNWGKSIDKILGHSIVQYLIEVLPGYSDDERQQVYSILQKDEGVRDRSSIFNLINQFSKEVIVEYDYKPYCRYEQLLRWRLLSHKVEQDLFVTAFFAQRDLESCRTRTCYTWEPVIKTDNVRLHNMLQEGLAENHFHLKGSSPYCHLSWISLMNRVSGRKEEYKKSRMESNKLSKETWFEEGIAKEPIMELVVKAAVIRAILFKEFIHEESKIALEKIQQKQSENEYKMQEEKTEQSIREKEEKHKKQEQEKEQVIKEKKKWEKLLRASSEELTLAYGDIDTMLAELRWQYYGLEIPRKSKEYIIDYAISSKKFTVDNDNYKLLLYGERRFMYDCFKKIFERKGEIKSNKYENLFYVYLLIKNKFRAEMIQVNDRVGFKNFADYQDRKTVFLRKDPLLQDAVHYMAIRATMEEQNILKLEARIGPEATLAETHEEIKRVDNIVKETTCSFIKDDAAEYIKQVKREITHKLSAQSNFEEGYKHPHFYVIHAIKDRDKRGKRIVESGEKEKLEMRDFKKRVYAKNMANQLMTLREKRFETASRIYGIDAAANEIGCRPEVFAQAFRVLKQHTVSEQYNRLKYLMLLDTQTFSPKDKLQYKWNKKAQGIEEVLKLPSLKVTYHAGEDFLDIPDGLRAIDEAIQYMNLSHGERIGHALALGVNVKEWYKSKNHNLVLPKQDYLDNICWMLNKIDIFKVPLEPSSYQMLEREYQIYYEEIYSAVKKDLAHINYRNYYNAWLLRGDDPEFYQKQFYEEQTEDKDRQISFWNRCSINESTENGDIIRKNKMVTKLYRSYHYELKIRKVGAEIFSKKIDERYIDIVEKIQCAMQKEIRNRGIGIETNPSSNYLIGTFKRYDKHPILKFYNLGLTHDTKQLQECSQLFVSINTDDQGVFGTYLENEYALLALALQKTKDEQGQPLYNQEMIYEWLNKIRLMGLQQSFATSRK